MSTWLEKRIAELSEEIRNYPEAHRALRRAAAGAARGTRASAFPT